MRLMFSLKKFKFLCEFQNHNEIFTKGFRFVRVFEFSQFGREYLPSAVNVLKNSRKISDLSKRDVFQLTLSQTGETIA